MDQAKIDKFWKFIQDAHDVLDGPKDVAISRLTSDMVLDGFKWCVDAELADWFVPMGNKAIESAGKGVLKPGIDVPVLKGHFVAISLIKQAISVMRCFSEVLEGIRKNGGLDNCDMAKLHKELVDEPLNKMEMKMKLEDIAVKSGDIPQSAFSQIIH